MKKNTLLLVFSIAASIALTAQTVTHQISTGAGYGKFAYYKLTDGTSQQVANDAWDIAFSNLGTTQAGIFFNESTNTVQGQAVPGIEAYNTGSFDFSEAVDLGSLTPDQLLFNPELSWAEGAFNTLKDPNDPLDLGWGTYNPATNQADGLRVFALKLRNGQYKKLFFESYNGQSYTFKAADLNGANEQTYTVTRTTGNGSPLVYFSFNNPAPATPVNWDLVFCRYTTLLFDGQGYIPYNVAGILSNEGILTAKAVGVDPATVDYHDYLDSLGSRLDIIGHDWKYFSGTAWTVVADHAYFAKTTDGKLYQIVFTNFGGSINGTATLNRTYLTQLSATHDLPEGILDAAVFPNPVADHLTVALTATGAVNAKIQLVSTAGQVVWSGIQAIQTGLNILKINQLPAIPAGIYTIQVQLPSGQFSRPIAIGGSQR